jgi:hypothetical protein
MTHPGVWQVGTSPPRMGQDVSDRYRAGVLLGDDLLEWILLAVGGALLVGNLMALVRPPQVRSDGDLERPPMGRTIVFMVIGAIAAVWAIASLVAG